MSCSTVFFGRLPGQCTFQIARSVHKKSFTLRQRHFCLTCNSEKQEKSNGVGQKQGKVHGRFFEATFKNEFGSEIMQKMAELPGTEDYSSLMARMDSLLKWKRALQKGILPHGEDLIWPEEPFGSKFGKMLEKLEIPNLTRRYPNLLGALLMHMVELVQVFEGSKIELENKNQTKKKSKQPLEPSDENVDQPQNSNGNLDPSNSQQGGSQGEPNKMELNMETLMDGGQNGSGQNSNDDHDEDGDGDGELAAELEELAEGIVHEFEEEIEQAVDSLNKARVIFDDLEDLIDESKGFDLSDTLWNRVGWKEMDKLRRKLEDLRELRDLVRQLGRGGGRGPKRKAPAQISKSGCPPGIVKSSLQPEETSGLCRSGDLSRMLPSEAAFMAKGWPRDEKKQNSRISKAAKLLHLARRAERNLMSYERTGWLDDEPSKVLQHMEYRPAAEQGPIIVCLDTSGSMQGDRETVAKALVLECLRGAHRQQRSCYLYAFSGYYNIREMELAANAESLSMLLDFLEHSFHGGTDVNGALELSIQRLKEEEWSLADILVVTDGEMNAPKATVLEDLSKAEEEMGLQVHGLLVGRSDSRPMNQICTHLHTFKSWDVIRRP